MAVLSQSPMPPKWARLHGMRSFRFHYSCPPLVPRLDALVALSRQSQQSVGQILRRLIDEALAAKGM